MSDLMDIAGCQEKHINVFFLLNFHMMRILIVLDTWKLNYTITYSKILKKAKKLLLYKVCFLLF